MIRLNKNHLTTEKPLSPKRKSFAVSHAFKTPGWNLRDLEVFLTRDDPDREMQIAEQVDEIAWSLRGLMAIPQDYRLVLRSGSARDALEVALWNFLGLRGIDIWCLEKSDWPLANHLSSGLALQDVRVRHITVDDGHLKDGLDKDRDHILRFSSPVSGLSMRSLAAKLAHQFSGLTFCDLSGLVMAEPINWEVVDVGVCDFQDSLGGENNISVLLFSPKAIEHLKYYQPAWAVPASMALKEAGGLHTSLLHDNKKMSDLSALSLADLQQNLAWAHEQGGREGLRDRVQQNQDVLEKFMQNSRFFDFTIKDVLYRSMLSVCISLKTDVFQGSNPEAQLQLLQEAKILLRENQILFDVRSEPSEPPMFRLSCGPTIDRQDLLQALLCAEWAVNEIFGKKNTKLMLEVVDFKDTSAYKEETGGCVIKGKKSHVAGLV